MQYPNLFKRIVPFLLTMILGLAVASLFVNIVPTFRINRDERRGPHGCREDYRRLKFENEELKLRLEEKDSSPEAKDADLHYLDLLDRQAEKSPKLKADKEQEKEIKKRLERLERIK